MKKIPQLLTFFCVAILSLWGLLASGRPSNTTVTFAVVGDYGSAGPAEANVASLVVDQWSPDFILTVGDNNYPDGTRQKIDQNIGQYYHSYIYPYDGTYGAGSSTGTNRFWPTLGNHDWKTAGAVPYLSYFSMLPGQKRYYDFAEGYVHFFAIDSDDLEPAGVSESSLQARWLRDQLVFSMSKHRVVYFHHSPYTSNNHHAPATWMQWPFKEWGATLVLSGHVHDYERLIVDGLTYVVNGCGGSSNLYGFSDSPLSTSQSRYKGHGAVKVIADSTAMTLTFVNTSGATIDSATIPAFSKTTPTPATYAPEPTVSVKGNQNGMIIGISVGSVVFVAVVGALIVFMRRRSARSALTGNLEVPFIADQ